MIDVRKHTGLVKNMAISMNKKYPNIEVNDIIQEINILIIEYSSPIPEKTPKQIEHEEETGKKVRIRTTTYNPNEYAETTFITNFIGRKIIQTLKFKYCHGNNHYHVSSLNSMVNDESNELIDTISSDSLYENEYNEEIKENEEISENLKNIIYDSGLTDSEKQVIIARYYNNDNNKLKTLEEIGIQFNLSKERIRQIEEKALNKLSNNKKIKELI